MKNFLVAAIVCAAVLYGVDAYFFNGEYYGMFLGMMSQIYQHIRQLADGGLKHFADSGSFFWMG